MDSLSQLRLLWLQFWEVFRVFFYIFSKLESRRYRYNQWSEKKKEMPTKNKKRIMLRPEKALLKENLTEKENKSREDQEYGWGNYKENCMLIREEIPKPWTVNLKKESIRRQEYA